MITNNGKLLVANTINSQNLINTSIVQGKTLDIKNKINSSGKILSDNILTKDIFSSGNISSKAIKTKELTNFGEIISNNLSSNNINNSKNIFVNGNLKIENNLNNSGVIEGLELNTNSIDNTGNITIKNKLTSQNLNNKKNTANVNAGFLDVQNKILSVGNVKAITLKTNNLDNSGSILTNSLTTSENINKGSITAKNISSQNLVNSGSVISDNITVSKNITNTNSIFANEKISADKISNSNKLVAKNTETINLTNTGNIVVKENLKTKDVTNSNSIKVGGNLNTDKLKNSKTLIARNITVEKSLDNINGKITSLNTNINTSDIKNNNGTIQAIKNINIITANDLSLDGNYTANDTLNIKAKSLENNVDLKNDGKITFNLSGNLTNNKNISSTGNLNIKAQKVLNTKNDSAIGSMANLSITASSLENKGNILFGEGKENKLKTTGNINNTGVISSLGKLKIEAKDVLNDKQIISDNDLTLDVNSITNKGLLYSTNNMKVDFKDIFLNDKAEIYSSGDITINSENGTFTNKVGEIESERNIKIVAKDIKNLAEVTGNYKVVGTVPGNQSNIDMSKVDIEKYNKLSIEVIKEYFRKYSVPSDTEIKKVEDYVRFDKRKGEEFTTLDGKKGQWTWQEGKYIDGVYLNKADKIESNYQSKKSTIKAAGDITLIAKNDVENLESNILANKDITIKANRLINKNYDIEVERNIEFIRGYEFHESASNPYDIRNKLVMDGKVLVGSPWDKGDVFVKGKVITYVGTGDNAKISAGGNINITANKVGNGVETKENVSVNFENKKATSTNVGKNSVNLDKVEIDKKNINVGVVTLNPKNVSPKEEIDTKAYINLPKNDKGLFRINKNNVGNKPGFSYLVETNINFIDKSRFYGSDYFFKRIGFNPNKDIRLLGDSFYETKLINRAILEGTGRRYLGNYKSDKEQMQALYDNAASEQADLNLSVGIALSKEQIAKLKKDIIWYVEEEVQGQKVLVPKVYLTRNTLSKLKDKNASIEAGQELSITAKDIQNAGNLSANNITITTDNLTNKSILGANKASIDGDTVSITAKNSVDNIGADIKAKENLTITAEDISNLSTQRTNGYKADVISTGENLASIEAKNITLDAKNNIKNTGAYIKADEKIDIKAKNVKIDTLEESRYYHDGDSNNYLTIDNKSNIASNIEAKNINMEAKKDIDIKGSNIVAKNEANIKADGDINIVSVTDSRFYAHKETNKGKFGKSSSEETITYATRNVASNIIGDKVNITSGKDVNILGSNVGAKDTGNISAKGTITEAAAKEINYSYHKKTKSGFMGLTGQSSAEKIRQELNAESNLYVKNQGIIGGDIKVIGSNLVLGNNSIINGKLTTDSNELHNSYSYEESKKGFSGSIGGGGFSVGYGKSESGLKEKSVINAKSNLVLGDGTVLNKGADITATNLTHGKITVNNGDVKFGARKDTKDVETYSKSSGVNLSVRIKSQALDRVQQGFDSFNQMKSGDMFGGIASATSTVTGIISGLASNQGTKLSLDAVKVDNTVGKDNVKLAEANNNFYANMGVNLGFNKSSSKTSSHNEAAVVTTIQGKESRNVLQQLAETRQAKTIYNVIDSRLQIAENQEDIAKAFEGVSEDLGYKVKVIYTDPSKSPQLIGTDKDGNTYIKDGTAYVDKKTGINYILINSESPANRTKAGVIGTIAEEQSHIIGKIEGRQKTVPDGSEKGLESLGRPTNDYFKNQYSENNKVIGIVSDGKDYSNVDFGEHVGDDYYLSPEEQHQFETSENAKMDDGSFIIVPKEKGDYLGDAIINDKVFYIKTDAYNYSKEGNNPKIIEELSKQAKVKSEIDPYNNYIVTVSREEGINILAVPKPKSWKENQSNDYNEAKGIVIKYHKKSKEDWRNKKYGSAILNRAISGISLLNLVQTGIGTTEAQKLYKFTPGEVQYGKVEDILARRARAQENAKGLIDNSVSAIAIAAIPNKIGGGTITIPETAQAVVATGEVVGTAGKVVTLPKLGTGGAKAAFIISGVGNGSNNSDKDNDISNGKQEKSNIKEETNKKVNDTQNLGNKNGDLYYDGRKVYTAKELNQMGRKKGGSPNRGVEYIYESPAGKVNAQEFQWGTSGSMMQNTPVGKKNVVPALRYDNPNTEGMNFIKFDGIEVENGVTCLIDAKRNVPYWNKGGMETVKGTLDRIKVAKSQNPGIRVVYEFPNEKAAGYFRKWINNNNGYDGIVEIRVRK
ncbi:hemagglutinin repeat-containing protein [Fusobacterium polymorphum]|uniref:hemagglutinin repeat-containing protein n=1 Tax=Fusobacterium nucleatum subsp. polymorphum TaxID=76857 RepID=UPI0030CDA2C2